MKVWGSTHARRQREAHNLIVIIDRNGIQIDGYTHDVGCRLSYSRENFAHIYLL